jgi:alkanesulfonate monooxygenase SsuD/methylene tetrahydromethanopterin reductase-like flavin-dependent oxidoreductase (luciferase family)
MAAGGPQSARTAAKYANGIITSVKNVDETKENIINAVQDWNKLTLFASRWSVYADSDESAWQALLAQRGLRAPSRATSIDPAELQKEVDELSHEEVLSKYSRINKIADYINIYGPLINDLKADTVTIQTTSLNQLETIALVGSQVLPQLHKL